MFQNAHTFGFVWYGPTINTWAYVGTTTTFSEEYKKKAALGLPANVYHYYKDNQGNQEPASAADLTNWTNKVKSGEINDGNSEPGLNWDYNLKPEDFDGYSNWATIYQQL